MCPRIKGRPKGVIGLPVCIPETIWRIDLYHSVIVPGRRLANERPLNSVDGRLIAVRPKGPCAGRIRHVTDPEDAIAVIKSGHGIRSFSHREDSIQPDIGEWISIEFDYV